jgi:hypothetical protein
LSVKYVQRVLHLLHVFELCISSSAHRMPERRELEEQNLKTRVGRAELEEHILKSRASRVELEQLSSSS